MYFLLVLYLNTLPLIFFTHWNKNFFVPLHRKSNFLFFFFWYVTAQKEQQTTKWIHKSKKISKIKNKKKKKNKTSCIIHFTLTIRKVDGGERRTVGNIWAVPFYFGTRCVPARYGAAGDTGACWVVKWRKPGHIYGLPLCVCLCFGLEGNQT